MQSVRLMYTYMEKQIYIYIYMSNTVKQVPACIKTDTLCLIDMKEWEWVIPCSLPPPGCVYCMCGLFIVSIVRQILLELPEILCFAQGHFCKTAERCSFLLHYTWNAFCVGEGHLSHSVVERRDDTKPDLPSVMLVGGLKYQPKPCTLSRVHWRVLWLAMKHEWQAAGPQ